MFVSSAPSKHRYVLEEYPPRVRGTPEYNPLYDAVDSTAFSSPRQQLQSDFRPITPTPPRFIENFPNDVESTYDKPRSYQIEHKQPSQQQLTCRSPKKGGESTHTHTIMNDFSID